jgi:hypothetical protein
VHGLLLWACLVKDKLTFCLTLITCTTRALVLQYKARPGPERSWPWPQPLLEGAMRKRGNEEWTKLETRLDMDTKIVSTHSGPRLLLINDHYYLDGWPWPLPRLLNWLWRLLAGR